ncbi:hypothetical protein AN958_12180 [Leucoagaricus sp. SymC.cos]|nr:hypothetical protein AN958_12180 [Leucoagaricus sp. SymC.cos]
MHQIFMGLISPQKSLLNSKNMWSFVSSLASNFMGAIFTAPPRVYSHKPHSRYHTQDSTFHHMDHNPYPA